MTQKSKRVRVCALPGVFFTAKGSPGSMRIAQKHTTEKTVCGTLGRITAFGDDVRLAQTVAEIRVGRRSIYVPAYRIRLGFRGGRK